MSFVKYFVIQFWKVMPKSDVWMLAETWSCSLLKVSCCQAKQRTPDLPCCFSQCAFQNHLYFQWMGIHVIQWDTWASQFLGLGPNDDEVLVTTQSMPLCATKTCELDWRAWISHNALVLGNSEFVRRRAATARGVWPCPSVKLDQVFPQQWRNACAYTNVIADCSICRLYIFYWGLFILISYNML